MQILRLKTWGETYQEALGRARAVAVESFTDPVTGELVPFVTQSVDIEKVIPKPLPEGSQQQTTRPGDLGLFSGTVVFAAFDEPPFGFSDPENGHSQGDRLLQINLGGVDVGVLDGVVVGGEPVVGLIDGAGLGGVPVPVEPVVLDPGGPIGKLG